MGDWLWAGAVLIGSALAYRIGYVRGTRFVAGEIGATLRVVRDARFTLPPLPTPLSRPPCPGGCVWGKWWIEQDPTLYGRKCARCGRVERRSLKDAECAAMRDRHA
jgi:hypothetical protein